MKTNELNKIQNTQNAEVKAAEAEADKKDYDDNENYPHRIRTKVEGVE